MYNVKSPKAEEFINHDEIMDTLAYAKENTKNRKLQEEILEKGRKMEGLNHREAAVLLLTELEDIREAYKELAIAIKKKYYGNRVVLFAPLYLSNYLSLIHI